ncbi:MAG TPA: hypothetical protein VNL71_01190 [Chloroflexota bacterium]|nr:hypothetical protein [Chloroflexota bacterium]
MAQRRTPLLLTLLVLVLLGGAAMPVRAADGSYLGRFTSVSVVASTVPANGDVNPYGVAVIKHSIGNLVEGDVLVSNFNAGSNNQGTGTTIVQVSPTGQQSLFAQIPATLPGPCPGGVGLTTALVVLRRGWVIVGSLPTTNGMAATAQAGCLLVLNSQGSVVETIADARINGPWDMTALDLGSLAVLFVTNVLNDTVVNSPSVVDQGTVVRLLLTEPQGQPPRVLQETVIGSGFPERTDPASLVIGPTGVGFSLFGGGDEDALIRTANLRMLGSNDDRGLVDTLYVADSLDNRVAAIPHALFRQTSAGIGQTVSMGGALNDPLGLAIAPNGDILTANGNDGNLVETTPSGNQITTKTVNPAGGGSLFGLATAPGGNGVYLVDDALNKLDLLH